MDKNLEKIIENLKKLNESEVVSIIKSKQNLNVPLENLRVESEQKLKGVFIRLTQVILEEGKSLRKVLKICFLALDDLLLGIEGVLRIKGVSIFDDEFRCIEKLEEITGFELDSFKEVLKIRSGMRRKRELKSLIYDFYEDVEKLAEFVDRMEV